MKRSANGCWTSSFSLFSHPTKRLVTSFLLVEIKRHEHLMRMNHYFAENVRKEREARLRLQLEALNSYSQKMNTSIL
jgi:hypothetical protein